MSTSLPTKPRRRKDEPLIIEVDDALAKAWFGRLLERGEHLDGLMRDVGEILTRSTQRRFDEGVGPDGVK